MRKLIRIPALLVLIWIAVSSCAPTMSARYFNTHKDVEGFNLPDQIYSIDTADYNLIEIGDELYITVISGNTDPTIFNQRPVNSLRDAEMISYSVDLNGMVKLPYVNKVKLAGLTIDKAVETLEAELSQYIYLPSVSMRIINNRIILLGEVNSPGVYIFNRKSISIYEAIASANDLSTYGNRKKVKIVRQIGGEIHTKYVDLTNDNLFDSEWFILEPNDIIYVEPMGRKGLGFQTVPYGLFFSILSTTLTVFTFLIAINR